jgi:hypothetical protein
LLLFCWLLLLLKTQPLGLLAAMMMGMEQNPYEAPRESAVSDQKGSAWNAVGISIAIAIAIGIMAAISLFDLLGYWLSRK